MPRRLIVAAAVTGACALAVVATALASSGTKSKTTSHHGTRHATVSATGAGAGAPGGPGGPPGPGGGPGAVHSESVVLDKKGDAFITVTSDSGKIKSLDAGAGTIEVTEEAGSVTYKTVTLTIPSGSTVMLDGKSSTLSGLAVGDHVTVSSSSEGTNVFATDSSFHPQGWGHGGPPPGGGSPPAGGAPAGA
jgi:hypothetical protein